jgi:hypothetical protein
MFNFQSLRPTWSVCMCVLSCTIGLLLPGWYKVGRGRRSTRSTMVTGVSRISVNFLSFCRLDGSHLSCNIPSWSSTHPERRTAITLDNPFSILLMRNSLYIHNKTDGYKWHRVNQKLFSSREKLKKYLNETAK